ncbi:MAG TPA: hypothetical protein VER58_17870 [Thermoanaerobaculia bacterium]|nr:hypothetical protein [Thermoanaerobaculia bacterium]
MAVTVENVTIWRKEVPHKAGELARALEPLAKAGADLKVIMAYAEKERGFIEVGPLAGKFADAATKAGFAASTKPTLFIEGDDRPGLGFEIAKAIADQGVSISFDVTQVIGKRYASVYGFQSADAARKAADAIKKVAR